MPVCCPLGPTVSLPPTHGPCSTLCGGPGPGAPWHVPQGTQVLPGPGGCGEDCSRWQKPRVCKGWAVGDPILCQVSSLPSWKVWGQSHECWLPEGQSSDLSEPRGSHFGLSSQARDGERDRPMPIPPVMGPACLRVAGVPGAWLGLPGKCLVPEPDPDPGKVVCTAGPRRELSAGMRNPRGSVPSSV